MMHPQDAERLHLRNGDSVWVESGVGKVQLPLWVSDDIMPGVVSMPHGWGHSRNGAVLNIAQRTPGVSMNDITDHRQMDALTGMALVNGVAVTVSPVQVPVEQDNTEAASA